MSGSSTHSRRPARKFRPEPFAYHQELTLQIETLTNLAHGIARVDGWVVMVPFALPGEKVVARVHANYKTYSEADLVKVLEPSPHRITPVCPLFGRCGGCQYQNLTYEQQLVWKQRQITELLQRMARIDHPVEPVHASPRQFGYRSKITPHFAAPREGTIRDIGFLEQGSRFRIVDVPHCDIAMPEINERLAAIREEVRSRSSHFRKGSTLLLRASHGKVVTNPQEPALEKVGPLELEFLAGDFFQNNPFILPELVEHVAAEASAGQAKFLIDAYCGSGLFALSCANRFQEVTGIEISETAVRRAGENAARNQITNCRFKAGSAEHIFAGISFPPTETAVIVDPPRAGCSEDFLQQLFSFGPATVIYVSCNPPTQMRDLVKFVEAGYSLRKVQPFDLFPQTRHLECVMTLVKGDSL
jgi:23S rRNA (uracil1939-C5)-methyltransferase/tRNA (uracil-5-)-methyltransferase